MTQSIWGAQEARQFQSFNDFWILAIYRNYSFGLKTCEMWLKWRSNRFFCRKNLNKSPNGWGLCPSVIRLSCIGLFSTGFKLDNFWAKGIYFWFKLPLYQLNPGCASARIHYCRQIFQAIIRAHTKRANKRCRAYMSLFSKMKTKL